MRVVNTVNCEPDEVFGRGAFHARVFDLTERLGASVIGAKVWEMHAGAKSGPYHFHPGLEEWMYVVAGTRRPRPRRPSTTSGRRQDREARRSTVLIQISAHERMLFRHEDRLEDYWDGEPGAA